MKKIKILVAVFAVVIVGILVLGVWKLSDFILWNEVNADYEIGSIRWAILGAIGSWAGSVFGAVALVVSILALWQPQRINIEVSVNAASMISQMPGIDRVDAYSITVKNVGLRSVTISNVYLNFGRKKNKNIFVGMLNQGSMLQPFTISFPKRLDSGESFDYYLLRDKLNATLAHYEQNTPRNTPFYVCVAEVVKGQQYYKTKWTLGTFIGVDK